MFKRFSIIIEFLQSNGKTNTGTKRRGRPKNEPKSKKQKLSKRSPLKKKFDYENANENEEFEVFFILIFVLFHFW